MMKSLIPRLALSALIASMSLPLAAQEGRWVDKALLRDPPPGEWLSYGRDQAETHYSPLRQIDSRNVRRLELAWSWDIPAPAGRTEATPLVSNGTMYGTGAWSVVFALDARTGEVKWLWDPAIVRGGRAAGGPTSSSGAHRGVALHGDKVFVGLTDGRLVALDTESGRVVWVRQTTPYGGDSEYIITGAPRIIGDKVIIGNSGAEYHGVRGYVTAYDAETGDQAWRFYTVPGDPSLPFESPAMEMAAKTWAGEWWKYGGGGTAWDSFSYDPEANLVYIGTGNGAPWSREVRSAGIGDNLFLSSIVALDANTGELIWYYQTTPGDDWDYTATHTMILAELVIDGRERKVVMQAPKNGFFYVLDRLTGELLSAEKITEPVMWASHVDLSTGRPVENPGARYDEVGQWMAPGTGGAHNWHPMSFNPNTGLAYIPGQNIYSYWRRDPNYVPELGRFATGTVRTGPRPDPPTPDPAGFLLAWDPVSQEERWRIPYDVQRNGGTLSTGGNLVFSGRSDGWILANEAETGDKLWEFQIGPGVASPITFEVDGKQYVAVLSDVRGVEGASGRVWTFALEE